MTVKKGIIVAGGRATRLHPATLAFGKQLLPLYDKPMIYYPIALLLESGIRDILLICTPRDKAIFMALLGDGSDFGARMSYIEQPVAKGIADAFALGADFIGNDPVCLILGDNFFHGPGLDSMVANAANDVQGATIFCIHVDDPRTFGVATIDGGRVTELEEKPPQPKSNWAVTGLYFYDAESCARAGQLKPSARGEMEITDLNIEYMKAGKLKAMTMGEGFSWFDLGTHTAILEAGLFVKAEEERLGRKVGCPFETAFRKGFLTTDQLIKSAERIENKAYSGYLKALAGQKTA